MCHISHRTLSVSPHYLVKYKISTRAILLTYLKVKVKVTWIYIARSRETSKALRHGSHSFTCILHRVCLYLVSVHQTALPNPLLSGCCVSTSKSVKLCILATTSTVPTACTVAVTQVNVLPRIQKETCVSVSQTIWNGPSYVVKQQQRHLPSWDWYVGILDTLTARVSKSFTRHTFDHTWINTVYSCSLQAMLKISNALSRSNAEH